MGGRDNTDRKRRINKEAMALAFSYYKPVRDSLMRQKPSVAPAVVRREAFELVRGCYEEVRDALEAGELSPVPKAVARIIGAEDVWRL